MDAHGQSSVSYLTPWTHRTMAIAFLITLELLDFLAAARADSGYNCLFGVSPPLPTPRRRQHIRALSTVFAPSPVSTTKFASLTVDALLSLRAGGGDDNIRTITSLSQLQAILDESRSNDRLVVLDFAANDCPPCRTIAPIYKELSRSEEFATRVVFCKVNVSDHPEVAERYGVDGWPTFLLFKGTGEDGEAAVVDGVVGGRAAKAGLYDLVAKHA